jgi:hypothetical protein
MESTAAKFMKARAEGGREFCQERGGPGRAREKLTNISAT